MPMVREVYTPVPLAASGVVKSGACSLGGFFCTTAGTLTLRDGLTGAAPVVVATFAVAVGFYALPFGFGTGIWADLAGGAIGTFGVAD
jgi:hypothetical protein